VPESVLHPGRPATVHRAAASSRQMSSVLKAISQTLVRGFHCYIHPTAVFVSQRRVVVLQAGGLRGGHQQVGVCARAHTGVVSVFAALPAPGGLCVP